MDPVPTSEPSGGTQVADNPFRRIWLFSMGVSVGTVATVFWYFNYTRGRDWVPLGYDTYYYLGHISQVVSSGPLQFAASQHYVEFLYPIVASVPVYLGASADSVEVILPVILACATVLATGVLALESRDWRVAILSVAFSSGWFAIYRMGADFQANLFAFPLLIVASALILRVSRKGEISVPVFGAFALLVVLAAGTHIETTDFFILAWVIAIPLLGLKSASIPSKSSLLMILASALIASPFTVAYIKETAAGLGSQYCVLPAYWLEVFGPTALLAVLGIGVLASGLLTSSSSGYLAKLVISWSALALAIGVLGYLTAFPISISDRALLLLPVPLISSFGTLWVVDHVPLLQHSSQTRLITILAIVIPILAAPVVAIYVAPHFSYFSEHSSSLVTCGST